MSSTFPISALQQRQFSVHRDGEAEEEYCRDFLFPEAQGKKVWQHRLHICMAPTQGPACWGVYAAQLGQEIGADLLGCRSLRCRTLGESRHDISSQWLWWLECIFLAPDTGILYILRLYRVQRGSHTCKITENLHRPQSLLLWLVPERFNTQGFWPPPIWVHPCLSWPESAAG